MKVLSTFSQEKGEGVGTGDSIYWHHGNSSGATGGQGVKAPWDKTTL